MRKLQFIALILFFIALTSCKMLRPTDFSSIRLDMTKQEVEQVIGKPTHVVGAKRYNDGILEIYEYKLYPRLGVAQDNRYNWLFFLNNKLQEFGDKNEYIPNEYDRYYNRFQRSYRR